MRRFLSSVMLIALFCSSAAAQEFKVVTLLPLTGPLSEYGVAAKNGFELARKEHPEDFRNIALVYDDTKYDTKSALASYRLYSRPGKASLIYVWGYGICQVLAPIAESEKFPMIAASADRSVSAGRNYVLRFNYYHEQISAALWEYLRAKGLKHIALIKTELAYLNGVADGMRELIQEGETLDILDTFEMGDMDFRASISRLRSKKFDALGVFLVGGQGIQFYRQARQLNFHPVTFGTDFFDSDAVTAEAGGAMDGVVFPTQEATSAFRERYKALYGNDFQAVWAANSYEFAMLIARLFGAGGHAALTHGDVMSKFRTTRAEPPAGAAEYHFNSSKDGAGFDFKVALRKIEGSKVVDVTEKPEATAD